MHCVRRAIAPQGCGASSRTCWIRHRLRLTAGKLASRSGSTVHRVVDLTRLARVLVRSRGRRVGRAGCARGRCGRPLRHSRRRRPLAAHGGPRAAGSRSRSGGSRSRFLVAGLHAPARRVAWSAPGPARLIGAALLPECGPTHEQQRRHPDGSSHPHVTLRVGVHSRHGELTVHATGPRHSTSQASATRASTALTARGTPLPTAPEHPSRARYGSGATWPRERVGGRSVGR